jgi:hypothetical protein
MRRGPIVPYAGEQITKPMRAKMFDAELCAQMHHSDFLIYQVSQARGHITVLDRRGLEARTCECYAVVKREYDRLLPARLAAWRASCLCTLSSLAAFEASASNPPIWRGYATRTRLWST